MKITVSDTLREIEELPREKASKESKMYCLYTLSQWFAISLLNALKQHPDNHVLHEVAKEELMTNNLDAPELWVVWPIDHREYLEKFITSEWIQWAISDKLRDESDIFIAKAFRLKSNLAIIANSELRFEPIIDKILQDNDLSSSTRFKHFWNAHKQLDWWDNWHGEKLQQYANNEDRDSIIFYWGFKKILETACL